MWVGWLSINQAMLRGCKAKHVPNAGAFVEVGPCQAPWMVVGSRADATGIQGLRTRYTTEGLGYLHLPIHSALSQKVPGVFQQLVYMFVAVFECYVEIFRESLGSRFKNWRFNEPSSEYKCLKRNNAAKSFHDLSWNGHIQTVTMEWITQFTVHPAFAENSSKESRSWMFQVEGTTWK